MSLLSYLKETDVGQDIQELLVAMKDKSGPLPDAIPAEEQQKMEAAFIEWLRTAKTQASQEEQQLLQHPPFMVKLKEAYFSLFYATQLFGTGTAVGGLLKLLYEANHNQPPLSTAVGIIAFAYTTLLTFGLTHEKFLDKKQERHYKSQSKT